MAVLLVEEEPGVIDFLLEALQGNEVRIVPGLEVVILQEFLVLEVSVLGLNSVELVTERKVVLVSLLDFENLSLELRDKKVFLVRSEVH